MVYGAGAAKDKSDKSKKRPSGPGLGTTETNFSGRISSGLDPTPPPDKIVFIAEKFLTLLLSQPDIFPKIISPEGLDQSMAAFLVV